MTHNKFSRTKKHNFALPVAHKRPTQQKRLVMENIYFIGIGGIGMSAIARFFLKEGRRVAGYDRIESELTRHLVEEGAEVHYTDDPEAIPQEFRNPQTTVVVYTPAIPDDHRELNYFRNGGFEVVKRSEVLGHLSEGKMVMAVAGSHGKTTTTTLIAWLNHFAAGGGQAFLGGISLNFGSNMVLETGHRFAVEADEFDRSFLRLHPDVAVVTSADADHLDIYGTHRELKRAFCQFISQIKPTGTLIIKRGVKLNLKHLAIHKYTYAYDDQRADFYACNIRLGDDGRYTFDIVCPDRKIEGCRLGVMGRINIENAVAAVAAFWAAGWINDAKLKAALAEFRGVKRRFECYINTPEKVYIDDYAHHPAELKAAIRSIRDAYPGRRLTVIFQPHLYTRTRDFYHGFAASLSLADEVLLLPIYPAREEPIKGVTSRLIAHRVIRPCRVIEKSQIAEVLSSIPTDVVVSFGAGDIDRECAIISQTLKESMTKANE